MARRPTTGTSSSLAKPSPARPSPAQPSWRSAKGPILLFVFAFAGMFGLFAAFFYGVLVDSRPFEWYLGLNARVSALLLQLLGDDARAVGAVVQSSRFRVEIRHGCDAILPAGLFVTAVLAFPVALRLKWLGMLAGTAVLLAVNMVRILSLYYTGVFWPQHFHTMHVDVWQPVFVFLALFFWILWALWATKPAPPTPAAADAAT